MAEIIQPSILMPPQKTWGSKLILFFRKKPLGAIGGLALLMVVFTAIFADQIAPFNPIQEDYPVRLSPPNIDHLFGTDAYGRDMFSRVVHGARVSLYVGTFAVVIGTVFGVAIGIATAYFGGYLDLVFQRFMDALMGFPGLVLALALVVALGASLNNVVFAIAIGFIPRMGRLARATALQIKAEDYILAAHSVGLKPGRIMLLHVLPNSFAPIMVLATGYLGAAIITEASLSFLGLGVPPPYPSWGRMLQFAAKRWLEAAPWLSIFPGLALTVTVFGFNLFGDALRDVLDPRLRGR
jgi:peptide/nickel transport system permease protein